MASKTNNNCNVMTNCCVCTLNVTLLDLYRSLLTFVANRSNVAGFCGILQEREIQQLEHNDITERSVWLYRLSHSPHAS
jgi:hypothetical protein